MDTRLISPDLVYESVMKLVRTLPTTWSGNAYYHNLTDMEQKVLERLVTVGAAESRVDIHVTRIRRAWWGLVQRQEFWFVYVSRGFNWINRTTNQGRVDSGISLENTMLSHGTRVYEFRLTSLGEKLRHCLGVGFLEAVRRIVDNVDCEDYPFNCYRVEWESLQRQQCESDAGKGIAAAQATATAIVGDTHIHVPEQPLPIVNVTIQMDEASSNRPMPKGHDDGWYSLAETFRGLGLNQSADVTRLVNGGKLRDNGKTNRERRIDPVSILEYLAETGGVWKEKTGE